MKKLIILPLVALILLGCSQPNTQQEADSKILQDEDLKKFREMVRNALPNSDWFNFINKRENVVRLVSEINLRMK